MRILAANKYYYLKGGAEKYFFDLTRLLEERENEVIQFSMQSPMNLESSFENYFVSNKDFEKREGFLKQFGKAMNVVYSMEARKKFGHLIRDNHVDLVHFHNISHQLSPSIILEAGKRGLPVVWTLHDYKIVCPTYLLFVNGELCERCKLGKFYNVVLRKCNQGSFLRSFTNCVEMYLHSILGTMRWVTLFVSPSRFLVRKVIDMGVDEKKVVHLPLFLRVEEYEPYPGDDGYFAYVGRLSREKGVLTLLDAAKELKDCSLKIVGGGELSSAALEASRSVPGIHVVGSLSGEALRDVWKRASFVVLPSEWYENLPYIILESFALGKPVIASRIGGIPELVIEGETGLLFEPGNTDELVQKIDFLRGNPRLRETMGKRARELVENEFSAEIHYSRLMEIYERAATLRKAA